MKAFYFYKEEWEVSYVRERLPDVAWDFRKGALEDYPDIGDVETEALCVFVSSPVGVAEMNRFPSLKLIATRSTGFDHIDVAEAKKRGIVVCSVPHYGSNTVAEHAFALLLTLSRRTYDAYRQVSEEGSFIQDNLRGFDLAGKTLGVVGCGAIGKNVVEIARGFDMRVLVTDMHEDAAFAEKTGATFVPLATLLTESDIVSLHTPHMESTHHMLNRDTIGTMKRGAYIINTARGGLIETDALVWGLKEGIIAGAGLDVLEEEEDMDAADHLDLLFKEHSSAEELRTVLENHYLIDHPRVIITPHIAFNTQEAVERILETTVENIKAFVVGTPQNIVS